MKFDPPLLQGTLIKRYKRFLADILLPGNQYITAHCPNSGSMRGLAEEGNTVWLSHHKKETRRLAYTLEIIKAQGVMVGVNTQNPNKLALEAIRNGIIYDLASYDFVQHEVKYGLRSRMDFLLTGNDKPDTYVEVKNVTLKEGGCALFPDAVTMRGTKHLKELMNIKDQGKRAVMLYLVQREDCQEFSIARSIDPVYAGAFLEAYKKGVEILVYDCIVRDDEIKVRQPIHLNLNF